MREILDGRTFTTAENTENGEVSDETTFSYHQRDNIVWAEYSGGSVVTGHLLGVIRPDGKLEIRYHHINTDGEVLAGTCVSSIVEAPNGRVELHESWQWFTGDRSAGSSRVVEVG